MSWVAGLEQLQAKGPAQIKQVGNRCPRRLEVMVFKRDEKVPQSAPPLCRQLPRYEHPASRYDRCKTCYIKNSSYVLWFVVTNECYSAVMCIERYTVLYNLGTELYRRT